MSFPNPGGQNYTLFLTFLAQDDLSDIYLYGLERWDEVQADDYQESLANAFLALQDNPYKGKQHRQLPDGYKSFHVGRHLIIYRVENTTIYVLRVLGDRMDVKSHI